MGPGRPRWWIVFFTRRSWATRSTNRMRVNLKSGTAKSFWSRPPWSWKNEVRGTLYPCLSCFQRKLSCFKVFLFQNLNKVLSVFRIIAGRAMGDGRMQWNIQWYQICPRGSACFLFVAVGQVKTPLFLHDASSLLIWGSKLCVQTADNVVLSSVTGVKVRLTVVHTHGYGDSLDNTNNPDPIIKYIDDQVG